MFSLLQIVATLEHDIVFVMFLLHYILKASLKDESQNSGNLTIMSKRNYIRFFDFFFLIKISNCSSAFSKEQT